MNHTNLRQRRLSLVAKLYELAAEFSDSELELIFREEKSKKNPSLALCSAITALIRLHEIPDPELKSNANETTTKFKFTPYKGEDFHQAQESGINSLVVFLNDLSIFPSIQSLTEVLPLPSQPKEARSRYIARAIRAIEAMPNDQRSKFLAGIYAKLKKAPDNFITKWSKLIKEL